MKKAFARFLQLGRMMWRTPVMRLAIIVLVSMIVIASKAVAQDDPTGFLSALPKDFNYWSLLIMAVSMVAHWAWKKFIKKEPTPDLLSWYGSNIKMTITAFGAGAIMVGAQWSVLSMQPIYSPAVLIACFTAGWTADSSLNKASAENMAKVANPPA